MADIVDVIRDGRARIARWEARFSHPGRPGDDPAACQEQAACWDTLAALIERQLRAEDEICAVVIHQAGSDGPARARSMLDDHQDIREIIREARLQPPGSRLWWQLTTAALTAWTGQFDREEPSILDLLRTADPALRDQLGRQWRAITDAEIRDQNRPASAPTPSRQPGYGHVQAAPR